MITSLDTWCLSFTPSTGPGLAPKLAVVEMKIVSSCQTHHMHHSSFGLERDSTERSSSSRGGTGEKRVVIHQKNILQGSQKTASNVLLSVVFIR